MKRLLMVVFFALTIAARASAQELSGDWIGGFKQNDRWVLIRAQFQKAGESGGGVLDVLQPAYRQATPPRTQLTEFHISDSSAHFRHVAPTRDITFDGKIDGNSLSGIARGGAGWSGPFQLFRVRSLNESALREYHGTYQFGSNEFLYLQTWNEMSETPLLYALRESGELRALYPVDRDRFFAGPGIALPIALESRIEFQRNADGAVVSLTWQRGSEPARIARRVVLEKQEDVRFDNGEVRLAGRLFAPNTDGKHPAVILVHGSGPQAREDMLPFARFLVRRGVAVLGYDKRGVGDSTGDWNTASYDDLAGDVLAAFEYLKTRGDIDPKQIGLLGISQASWIMPLAAVSQKDFAFLISLSSAGAPGTESQLDYTQNEMKANGAPEAAISQQVVNANLLYHFLRTGEGWEKYAASAPPGTVRRDDPRWEWLRKVLFYDPVPTLEKLQVPTLAIWGELDNNTVPAKNKPHWEAALKSGGNRDYTLVVLPKTNHDMLEAEVGSSAELPRLRRFVPEYSTTILNWLATRIHIAKD